MRKRTLIISSAMLFAACTSPEEARRQSYAGTQNGAAIYEYTVQHWPTALWSQAKLEGWIKRDGLKLCPQGYREISRTREKSHVTYSPPIPMTYTDIKVRIVCK